MIEVTQYQCEICGRRFIDDELAAKCEQNHQKDPVIEGMTYKEGIRYPYAIEVVFEDGVIQKFWNTVNAVKEIGDV